MTTPITGFTPTVVGDSKPKNFNSLNGEDFIKIMITQLQQQDPMNPSDSNQMLTQLSQIKSMESSDTLNKSLQGLTVQQSVAAGANLIGKNVQGVDDSGTQVQGTVQSVLVQDQKVYLQLDGGGSLALSGVTGIAPVQTAATTPLLTTPVTNGTPATQAVSGA